MYRSNKGGLVERICTTYSPPFCWIDGMYIGCRRDFGRQLLVASHVVICAVVVHNPDLFGSHSGCLGDFGCRFPYPF